MKTLIHFSTMKIRFLLLPPLREVTHYILDVTASLFPFPQSFARSMYCRDLDLASVGCLSIPGIISFRLLCKIRGPVQQDFVMHTQDSFHVLCVQKYKCLKKSSMALFLPSNIHQGDEIFSVQSRGMQCAFMSLSALSFRFIVLLF